MAAYTYLEVHPTVALGVCAALVPYPEHDQAPRWIYASSMLKQAIGVSSTAYRSRQDTVSHVLWYPQRPLVTTTVYENLQMEWTSFLQNAVIGVLAYNGYNQEDSLLINGGAIERGLFRATTYRTYTAEVNRHGTDTESFGIPPPDCEWLKSADYSKLDADGAPGIGVTIEPGDIIIGKVLQTTTLESRRNRIFRDHSVIYKGAHAGIVDTVLWTTNDRGDARVRITLRIDRTPIVGDKFASLHAQKGVAGAIVPEVDMPFTRDGMRLDLIINPHAIPSRMTVGHLLEALAGKVAALSGEREMGTAFCGRSPEEIGADLHALGYERFGNERLFSGISGTPLNPVFVGAMSYMRLVHLARDKLQSRNMGPVNILTRQPSEGRARGGGLRFGEMERDATITHGAAGFLHERLCLQSDAFDTVVCAKCNTLAQPGRALDAVTSTAVGDWAMDKPYCRVCDSHDTVSPITIPYATKLLSQELEAMSIGFRFVVEKTDDAHDGPVADPQPVAMAVADVD